MKARERKRRRHEKENDEHTSVRKGQAKRIKNHFAS